MLDGLLPETCIVLADNVRMDRYGDRTQSYDLVEFKCEGSDRRVEIRRRHMDSEDFAYGMEVHILHNTLDYLTRQLMKGRPGCQCARHVLQR